MNIEPLESRIAPAAVFKFTDVDFDDVTITTSKGNNAQLAAIVTLAASGVGNQLQKIDFSADAATFAGTKLTITARRAGAGIGDGLVNVGYVDASAANGGTALDLGTISIKGDLGQIDAGDGNLATAAVKALKVRSMGEFGTSTQGAAPDRESRFDGPLASLMVAGNLREVNIYVDGGAAGKLGGMQIGGSIIGGSKDCEITSEGAMGPVKIAGNVEGGSTFASAKIRSQSTLASVTIGGSLLGGTGQESGYIRSQGTLGKVTVGGSVVGGGGTDSGLITGDLSVGSVKIGGDLRGGSKTRAGSVISGGGLASFTVVGSIVGGAGDFSGRVSSGGDSGAVKIGGSVAGGAGNQSGAISGLGTKIGSVVIAGDLLGGSVSGTASLAHSGVIFSVGRIGSVTIGGSIVVGTNTGSGTLENSGAIFAGADIGSLTVKGSIIGNALTHARLSAAGQVAPGATTDLAFGSIAVGGRVEFADFLAGFAGLTPVGVNADAQIGKVVVGDWIASNLVAGVASGTLLYGDADDVKLSGLGVRDSAAIVSRIASITIKNSARGTLTGGDHFGFVAQQIGALTVAGTGIPQLQQGAANDLPPFDFAIGTTGDLRLREIAL